MTNGYFVRIRGARLSKAVGVAVVVMACVGVWWAVGRSGRSASNPSVINLASPSDGPMVFATGQSSASDPVQAAIEAADQARMQLAGQQARLVLVFDQTGAPKQVCEGVATVFDQELVYGCSAYSPITERGNESAVGVLAVAGRVHTAAVLASLEGGYLACGQRIGQAIDHAALPETPGQVMLLFGKCHVPANNQLVLGVRQVLGDTFPIVGGAASESQVVYHQGQVVHNANIGILMRGDFTCGFSTQRGQGKQEVLRTAQSAVLDAVPATPVAPLTDRQPGVAPVDFVFAFNCGGRRTVLGRELPEELDRIRRVLADTPIFGFYGSGEIGPSATGQPAQGVGFHIAVCAIRINPGR